MQARTFLEVENRFFEWIAKGSVSATPRRTFLRGRVCYEEYHITTRAPSPPPWKGSNLLALLKTGEEIQYAGWRFGNCLSTLFPDELDGRRFYEWRGPEPAMASIGFHSRLGWLVDEISGMKNRPVESHTRDAIVAEFSDGDVRCRSDALGRMDEVTRRPHNQETRLAWLRTMTSRNERTSRR